MPEFSLIQKIIIFAIPVVFAITVHEVAHGWVASRLGDQTARLLGRLTLNPVRHIDPIGTILVPALLLAVSNFVFGWAKPVPVDWRNLRHPRRDMAWVAVAGPAANLLMLVLWALVAKLAQGLGTGGGELAVPLFYMALAGITINAILMLLNLIPFPPLDGSRILSALLPARAALQFNRLERYGLIIILLLFATGILGRWFWPLVAGFQEFVFAIFAIR